MKSITVSLESQRTGEYATEKSDCTVRALAAVACLPYGAAHRSAELAGRKPRTGMSVRKIEAMIGEKFANYKVEKVSIPYTTYTRRVGFMMRHQYQRSAVTLARFALLNPTGRFYVITSSHALALVDGVYVDAGKPRARVRVEGAWKFTAI